MRNGGENYAVSLFYATKANNAARKAGNEANEARKGGYIPVD